jgi:hypothetical protein
MTSLKAGLLRRMVLVLTNVLDYVEVGSLEYFDLIRVREKIETELRQLDE